MKPEPLILSDGLKLSAFQAKRVCMWMITPWKGRRAEFGGLPRFISAAYETGTGLGHHVAASNR
jgi:hypothetical protein